MPQRALPEGGVGRGWERDHRKRVLRDALHQVVDYADGARCESPPAPPVRVLWAAVRVLANGRRGGTVSVAHQRDPERGRFLPWAQGSPGLHRYQLGQRGQFVG
uniref:(northern house mosquito) hypothetical protein n=1 Tax=Culex pipiens TaxID=7175 RepID=A0A8D8I4H0_CULPI